ncbi:MAG: DUF1598 domain-containing protein [Planctomycetaceae bacterium]
MLPAFRKVLPFVVSLTCLIGGMTVPPAALAQFAGGTGTGGAGTGGTGTGGVGTGGVGTGGAGQGGAVGGILVDADGVVHARIVADKTGTLDGRRRAELARRGSTSDYSQASSLRKVSLARLESACEPIARAGQHVSDEMQYLAGLQRIDYLFVDPDSRDLVIAGPAEGFVLDNAGRAVGVSSGRPPLRLDDLLIALRALSRSGGTIGCSIDPQEANLAKLQTFLRQTSGEMTAEDAKAKFARLAPIVGRQDVSVFGVPADSHFAQVLVDADFRIKRLSLGLGPPPLKGFKSHLALVGPGESNMQRWWFAPLYEAFVASPDGLAYAFRGQRVQMLAQEELVSAGGRRMSAAFTHVSSKKFAQQFTDRYAELASAVPVYAELQNMFDLAVLAALFKKERLPERIGWRMELFLDSERAALTKHAVPRQVDSLSNYKVISGKLYVAQVCGGVTIDPQQVLMQAEFQLSEDEPLRAARATAFPAQRPADHPWWWD